MSRCASVLAGVAIRRVVATKSRTAFLTRPQVDPLRADLHALGALAPFRMFDSRNRRDVSAGLIVGHASLSLVKHAMHERDGDRTLADRRRDALDIARPHVADRKHAWQARFQ